MGPIGFMLGEVVSAGNALPVLTRMTRNQLKARVSSLTLHQKLMEKEVGEVGWKGHSQFAEGLMAEQHLRKSERRHIPLHHNLPPSTTNGR